MNFLNFDCFNSPFHASGCQAFWFNSLLIFSGFCTLVIILLLTSYCRERSLINAFNERMKRKGMIADDDVLNKVKWKSDAEFDEFGLSELSQKMRDELSKDNDNTKNS